MMAASVIEIAPKVLKPEALMTEFRRTAKDAGAVVSFTGIVRSEPGDDPVLALNLQTYPGYTDRMVADHVSSARARWTVTNVLVHHRTGRVEAGEAIVLVAVAARHRQAAFLATDYLMDQLKSRTPLWKQEIRRSGTRWIEPRGADADDLARWDRPHGVGSLS